MLIGLVSLKGGPGVTSTAVALTALSGGVMIELDPSGGSIDCWHHATGEPTLVPTASALRRQAVPEAIVGFATTVAPGVRVIRAPTSGPVAESTIAGMADRLLPTLAPVDSTIVVDAGRWARTQPTARRIRDCDVVGVVCSPTIEGVAAARSHLDHVAHVARRVHVIAVGDQPYCANEIAEVVQAPVSVVAWDRRGLAQLIETGASKGWARSALARSTRVVLDELTSAHTTENSDDGAGTTDRALRHRHQRRDEATHA
ncbi:MAG: hypothetical protein CL424_17840 [Acidimicrobiaceae bacterium]|nr:hypothetical protein [Acidimicrobiaceae bacterium]